MIPDDWVDSIIKQPKLNVESITDMSALGERELGRDAASAFLNEHEARGITIETQRETIAGLTATVTDQANRLDILQRSLNEARADANTYLRYASTLGEQVRSNVASNVRALEIANDVFARLEKQEQTDAQAADVERLLAGMTNENRHEEIGGVIELPDFLTQAKQTLDGLAGAIDHVIRAKSMAVHTLELDENGYVKGFAAVSEPPVAMPAERADMTDATRSLMHTPVYDASGRVVGL